MSRTMLGIEGGLLTELVALFLVIDRSDGVHTTAIRISKQTRPCELFGECVPIKCLGYAQDSVGWILGYSEVRKPPLRFCVRIVCQVSEDKQIRKGGNLTCGPSAGRSLART